MSNAEIIEKVMNKVEEFYMGDGPDSGENIFNEFAAKHSDKFEGDYDAPENNDNKLE